MGGAGNSKLKRSQLSEQRCWRLEEKSSGQIQFLFYSLLEPNCDDSPCVLLQLRLESSGIGNMCHNVFYVMMCRCTIKKKKHD